jgi:hypothetical protein
MAAAGATPALAPADLDADALYNELKLKGRLERKVFETALRGYRTMSQRNLLKNPDLLTVIDYTRCSSQKRFYVMDLRNVRLLYQELVAHGRGTGDNCAERFSNDEGSLMNSLGFYTTAGAYTRKNGHSLQFRQ